MTSTLYNGKGGKTNTNFANDKTSLGGGQHTTKKLPDLHLTYNSAGETMAGVKPSRTLVGQTSDSEQEGNVYQGQSIKMPLIKAGSQLGDIYQNPNNKLPKGIGNEIIPKKQ